MPKHNITRIYVDGSFSKMLKKEAIDCEETLIQHTRRLAKDKEKWKFLKTKIF